MQKLMAVAITLAGLFASTFAYAQNALNGAWRATEVVVTGGEDAGTYTNQSSAARELIAREPRQFSEARGYPCTQLSTPTLLITNFYYNNSKR